MPSVVLGASEAMRRREFNGLFASTAVEWPLTARAQQWAMPDAGGCEIAAAQPTQKGRI
jgi:hypothetical protein